ncbi:MAG: hypothetical protein AB8I08_15990 [Sandaracinaceae bacterium]
MKRLPWLFAPLMLLAASTALAQEAPRSDVDADVTDADTARQLFLEGLEAYEAAEFERALEAFERSNEIVNSAELVFNIARSAEQIGRHQLALDSYLLFLEVEPDVENRDWVERRVAFLRTQIEEPAPPTETPAPPATPDPTPPAEPTPTPSPVRSDPTGPVALIVTGAVVAVTGAALLTWGLVERAEIESLSTPTPWPDLEDRVARSPIISTFGGVTAGVGVALLVSGVAWLAGQDGDEAVAIGAAGVGPRF